MADGQPEGTDVGTSSTNENTTELGDEIEKENVPTSSDSEPDFPDGGFRAWLVVVGVRPALFSVFCLVLDLRFYFTDNGRLYIDARTFLRECVFFMLTIEHLSRFGYVNAWGVSTDP
jgi:hypothetical protein